MTLEIEGIAAQRRDNGVTISLLYTFQNKTKTADYVFEGQDTVLLDAIQRGLRDLHEQVKEEIVNE
jgi:hypothetical protein